MLIRDRKDVDRSARPSAEYDLKSAAKSRRDGARLRLSSAGEGTFGLPEIDQDRLTIVSLFTIAVLTALNVILRFPELGAVIASYNQF
ncbi:MAG: hypothetical protein WAV27_06215 [Xanthobacteraceae bacterium]|jgi:hypothetical protein